MHTCPFHRIIIMANGQTYYMATSDIIAFINSPNFEYKNPSELSRAANIKSAKTTKKIIAGELVSIKSAKAIYKVCFEQGYKGHFDSAFKKTAN